MTRLPCTFSVGQGSDRMTILMHFVLVLMTLFDQIQGYDLSLNGNAIRNQPVEIYMNIGTINTAVGLKRPDTSSAGTCFAPIGGTISCDLGLTQDLTNGITTFSIASVSRATDQGVWISQHGSDSGNINITVLTIPTLDVNQPAPGSSIMLSSTANTETVTTIVTCAYPHVFLDLAFKPQGGGSTVSASSSTSTCTSTGNTGCADTDANSYNCTITPQNEAGLVAGTTYNIHVTVNLDGQYQSIGLNGTITGTDITVQGTPTTPTTPTPSPCRCDWDWLPCDWECYYFYIIIAAVVVVFLLVVGVCCCCRHDDAEACVCCIRKKKMCKDSVNLNENENGNGNGQKNVLTSSENGRQVNPSESGKEDTSESHCHNNPAYYASEGTDM